MADISVAQSGNWSATSTWTGGVLPSSTDTISVLGNKTLTVDGNYVCAGGTCATGSKIALAAGCSLETTGLLTMGTSTLPRTSYLEFGAGSELKLNGGDLQLWACGVTTNGTTKSSPAKISGSSNITCSANTGRGYFNCTYLLFVLTGTVLVRWGNVASSFTDNSSYRFYNCTFGATSFDFGSATIPVSGFAFNYCDFRESTPTFYFSGNSGESEIKYTTMSAATVKTFTLRGAGVTTDFTGSIFNNMYLSLQTKNAANLGMSSVFAALTSAPSGQTLIGIEGDATSGNAVSDASYYYVSTSNLRVLNLGSAATASNTTAKHEVKNSVLELPVSDGGNPIVIGPHKTEITRNLMLGYLLPWASRAYAVGGTAQGLDVVRNTQHCPAGDIAPALVSFEQGDVDYPAPINAHSNLSIWATTPFSSSYASLACERSSVVNDSLNIVGHNATYGAGTGPRYVAASISTDLTTNDIALASVPAFVDPTRKLASWGAANGADGTVQGAIDLLLARNGYDSATKSQNGTASSVTPADLVSWVRAGFAPTTAALDGTGYLGVDIGAMDVVASDSIAPVISSLSATATGTTTATLTVTTDEGNGSIFFLLDSSATATEAAILAGLSQSVTATGEQTINISALDASTSYYAHVLHRDAASNVSNILHSSQFTTDEAPPVVYPVVTATAQADGSSAVSASATTTKSGGTISAVVTASVTPPSSASIIADPDDTATVTSAGAYALSVSGLTHNTQYYWHIVHVDGESLESSVITVPVRTLDLSIELGFPDTAPCSLLGYQVWSKLTVTDEEIAALWS